MTVLSEMRATFYPADPGQPVDASFARLESATEVAHFLEQVIARAERSDPACLLVERGVELDPQPHLTRDELAEFRFDSTTAVGLDAARTSWLRWYLTSMRARLNERKAGSLTLFSGHLLANLDGSGDNQWNDALGGDLFIAWRGNYPDQTESNWLDATGAQIYEVRPGSVPLIESFDRLCAGLQAIGVQPVPLPIEPPLYVLPLLAQPDDARGAIDGYDAALDLARRVTSHDCRELDPDTWRALELACLSMTNFAGDDGRRVLVRWQASEYTVLAGDQESAEAAFAALAGR